MFLEWREEPIARHHDRAGFDCGSTELNEYLERYARQNHERGGAKTFVAVFPGEPDRILGYYSIAPGSIESDRAPEQIRQRLGRYPIPVFRLARLGVDQSVQGQGLGGEMLFAAAERALAVANEVGGMALVIDAKDEAAAEWYARFGAVPLRDDPLKLFLPLATVQEAIERLAAERARDA
ncbi:MAG: GNAT family N-acetyltransferase [Dehalococcoidia bacterium]